MSSRGGSKVCKQTKTSALLSVLEKGEIGVNEEEKGGQSQRRVL